MTHGLGNAEKDFPGPCPPVIKGCKKTWEENTQGLFLVKVWRALHIGVGDFDRKVYLSCLLPFKCPDFLSI